VRDDRGLRGERPGSSCGLATGPVRVFHVVGGEAADRAASAVEDAALGRAHARLGYRSEPVEVQKIESKRRVARLVLAIQAWRLERGALPKSLGALVPEYLGQLPMDPVSGQPYRLFPEGMPFDVQALTFLYSERQAVSARTPVVTSAAFEASLGLGPVQDDFRKCGTPRIWRRPRRTFGRRSAYSHCRRRRRIREKKK